MISPKRAASSRPRSRCAARWSLRSTSRFSTRSTKRSSTTKRRGQHEFGHFAALAAHSPFIQAWRIACLSEGGGTAVLRLPLQPMHLNSIGTVHGGVVASLADTACGIAFLSVAPAGARFVTASLNVNYVGAAQGDFIDAEAAVVAVRRRVAFVEATLKDAGGEVIARASVVFSVSTASAAV